MLEKPGKMGHLDEFTLCESVVHILLTVLCSALYAHSYHPCSYVIVFLDISGALFKSSILGGFFVSGTIPLFYELSVESTYPIAEGVTTGLLTIINNSFTVIFLLVLMVPGVGE